jgi:hypothetical protein
VQLGEYFIFSREKESKNPPYIHLTEVEAPLLDTGDICRSML